MTCIKVSFASAFQRIPVNRNVSRNTLENSLFLQQTYKKEFSGIYS